MKRLKRELLKLENRMKLYIDGDAFPNLLKPILFRAIEKLSLCTFVVSNKRVSIGKSKNISYIIVDLGVDEADSEIKCGGFGNYCRYSTS